MMCIVWSLTLLHVNALKKWILLEDPMAPVQLECSVGGECQYKTQLLEYAQADIWNLLTKQLVEAIVIESLRRPDLKLDSSFKEWSEFLMTWNQYKDEYQLAGSSLIRQLFACCTEELRHSLSRSTGGSTRTQLYMYKSFSDLYNSKTREYDTFWQHCEE